MPNLFLYIAWIQALFATVLSLYLSDVLLLAPCVLCWYQRILMYPLVLIIPVGIIRKDKNLPFYVLPLSILGMMVALYHYLLQKFTIIETLFPCTSGISCATKYIEWFGFITIPLMSFAAFASISFCMFIKIRYNVKR